MNTNSRRNALLKRIIKIILVSGLVLLLAFVVRQIWRYYPINSRVDIVTHPAWSPDGKLLAFECVFLSKEDIDYRPPDSYLPPVEPRQDICISNIDGSNFQRITKNRFMYYPAWSPKGDLLAWMNGYDNVVIWNKATSELKQFHSNQPLFGHFFERWDYLNWSTDGRLLFLQGSGVFLDTQTGLFSYPTEPSKNVPSCCSTWSPDGIYLAVLENHSGSFDYYKVRIYEQQNVVFESLQAAVLGRLSWSKDSTTLTWVGSQPQSETDPQSKMTYSLFLTYIPTGETVSVPNRFEEIYTIANPTWIASDKKVAYTSFDRIFWLDIKRSYSPFAVGIQNDGLIYTGEGSYPGSCAWSPDGKSVSYTTSDRIISIASLNGGIESAMQMEQFNRLTPLELFQILVMSFKE